LASLLLQTRAQGLLCNRGNSPEKHSSEKHFFRTKTHAFVISTPLHEGDIMTKQLCLLALLTSTSLLSGAAMADPTVNPNERAKPPSEADTVVTGPTPISKMSTVSRTDTLNVTATSAALIGRIVKTTIAGPASVHVSAEIFPGCRYLVSLEVNNVVVPGPGDALSPMAMHDTAGELSTNGFNWVIPNLPAGNNRVVVKVNCSSGTGSVDERSMIVYHR
jgi:hypothetical protein